ncbi:uncharacterized protein LOC128396354 [Panonychus citri]|uniref:uncharacterized protein LOC128396354 n=1 Tax=Panonychus citri TaxID=50023 RepID=UPI00230822AE|nr:uncharacterized protein LOC128396354 [Panonychus citri]
MKDFQSKVINIDQWVEENGVYLKPPICNKLVFNGQLKIFLVGGPNQRNDYHVENGEEIFIMLKGDMILNIIEQGHSKALTIREGEIFVLPSRVPHSPQRFADTLGMVIERKRLDHELDCLRYYIDSNCNQVLFEKWFHLVNLDTDLKPIIESFKSSIECATGRPTQFYDNSLTPHPDDRTIKLQSPIYLLDWFKFNYLSICEGFSFLYPQSVESRIGFYGPGKHIVISVDTELFIWHLGSYAKLTIDDDNQRKLTFNDTMIIDRGSFFILVSDGPTFIASMKPFTSTVRP